MPVRGGMKLVGTVTAPSGGSAGNRWAVRAGKRAEGVSCYDRNQALRLTAEQLWATCSVFVCRECNQRQNRRQEERATQSREPGAERHPCKNPNPFGVLPVSLCHSLLPSLSLPRPVQPSAKPLVKKTQPQRVRGRAGPAFVGTERAQLLFRPSQSDSIPCDGIWGRCPHSDCACVCVCVRTRQREEELQPPASFKA